MASLLYSLLSFTESDLCDTDVAVTIHFKCKECFLDLLSEGGREFETTLGDHGDKDTEHERWPSDSFLHPVRLTPKDSCPGKQYS